MQQNSLNCLTAEQPIVASLHAPTEDGARFPVIDGGLRQHLIDMTQNRHRGTLRKAFDALFHFVGYYPNVPPHVRRQWD